MATEHTIDVGTWLHPVPKQDGSCCHRDCDNHISPCHRLLGGGADPHGAADRAGKLHCLLLGAIPYPDLRAQKQGKTKQDKRENKKGQINLENFSLLKQKTQLFSR